jgi:nicotinamide phosphoribosyltransferase
MTNALSLISMIARTDSYKMSMWKQYPPGTTHVSSYIESRGGEERSVFFGLQAFIKQYLLTPITMADIDRAERRITAHGLPFNRKGWEIIVNEFGGLMPVRIQAVPEGTVMETHNVQVQITNTDPRLFWLVTYLETALLRAVWYPSTVATKSRKLKVQIAKFLAATSDVPVNDQIGFKLYDFGARGASSAETAMLGGMGHLVNFCGSDNFESIEGTEVYYNQIEMPAWSIPASEHSTITSWGRPSESEAYENMVNQFGGEGKIFAVVSDSYDIYNAVDNLWGDELKDLVESNGGTLVVRPDSGDPTIVPIEVIKRLAGKFGFTINSKGYKVLPTCVRVIQGDGINEDSLVKILENLEAEGFSAENITFGLGGGLLQFWNRDTLKYAMKASAIRINESEWVGFAKDPITDKGKKSKEGRLALTYKCGIGACGYRTLPEYLVDDSENVLRTVFVDGKLLIDEDFSEIRKRAELVEDEYIKQLESRYE